MMQSKSNLKFILLPKLTDLQFISNFKMNKLVLVLAVVSAQIQECLRCKHLDMSYGFMYSWSYCRATQTCVEDAWTKLNRYCEGGYEPGYTLDIDQDCEAKEAREPFIFESGPTHVNYFTRSQYSLPVGTK